MSNYQSESNLERFKKIRLRVTVQTYSSEQSNFIISVGQQWTISQVANKALNAYIEIFVKNQKLAKLLTVKAVKIDNYYMSKIQKVKDLLQNDDWILCQIVKAKSGFGYQQQIIDRIRNSQISKIKNKLLGLQRQVKQQPNHIVEDQKNDQQIMQHLQDNKKINRKVENQRQRIQLKNAERELQLKYGDKIQTIISGRALKKEKVKEKKKKKKLMKTKQQLTDSKKDIEEIQIAKEINNNFLRTGNQLISNVDNSIIYKNTQIIHKQKQVQDEGKISRKKSLDKKNDKNNTIQSPDKNISNPQSPKVTFHGSKIDSPSLLAMKDILKKDLDEPFSLNKDKDSSVSKKHVTFITNPIIEGEQTKQKTKKQENKIKQKVQIIVEEDSEQNDKGLSPKITLQTNQNEKSKKKTQNKFKVIDQLLERYKIQDSQ